MEDMYTIPDLNFPQRLWRIFKSSRILYHVNWLTQLL